MAADSATTVDLVEALEGHVCIPRNLWDFIPYRAKLRIILAGDGSRESRFRYGGRLTKRDELDGEQTISIGWMGGGMKLKYGAIDEIWKRYDDGAFIELHMIATSLLQKDRQIAELTRQIEGKNDRSSDRETIAKLTKVISAQARRIEAADARADVLENNMAKVEAELSRVAALESRLRNLVRQLGGTK